MPNLKRNMQSNGQRRRILNRIKTYKTYLQIILKKHSKKEYLNIFEIAYIIH